MRDLDIPRVIQVSLFTLWAMHAAAEVFVRDLLAASSTDRRTSSKSSASSSSSTPMTGFEDALQSLLAILSQIIAFSPLSGSMEAQICLEVTGVNALSDG
ncbi:hypothetical protein BDV11DRAFT_171448 [Aspergillus similis]